MSFYLSKITHKKQKAYITSSAYDIIAKNIALIIIIAIFVLKFHFEIYQAMAKNIFEGIGSQASFVTKTYDLLMTRRWITYADIMAAARSLESTDKLKYSISKYKDYGDLKKAFCKVRNTIKKITRDDNCIESEGSNQNKRFRYIGKENDPLASLKNAVTIKDLNIYWQFCQDSAGFLPTVWLEYFFKNSQDLFDIKLKRRQGVQIIMSDIDRKLTNIEMLPMLYEAIKQEKVLTFNYNPFGESLIALIFHPHLLKEFNGRWYLFGHANTFEPYYGYNVAIDRIIGQPIENTNVSYIKAPDKYYENLFNNLIGVTHHENNKACKIHIRANNLYMYKLIETKPLHSSQVIIKPYDTYGEGSYGEFQIKVEVNNEFIGRILQMGDGLEVISPTEVRNVLADRIKSMYSLYK